MITDPESVDVHDVTIALAEANLSLSMTKAIIDRAIRAYRRDREHTLKRFPLRFFDGRGQ